MTAESLTQYLKRAAELEASVYRQEEARKAAHEALKKKNVVKKSLSISEPIEQQFYKPSNPKDYSLELGAMKFTIILGVLGMLPCIMMFKIMVGMAIFILLCSILLVSMGVWCHKHYTEKKVAERQQYEIDLRVYEEQSSRAKSEFQEAKKRYKLMAAKQEKQNQEEYEEECRLADRNFKVASEAAAQLDAPLEETKHLLEALYETDVIFPKYRNLVAMCTIYEYFAAGRCTELAGPTGAYNLYESEVRQNLIINRLDTIVDQLEQIKANQYMLYTQLEKNNRILSGISGDIKGILASTYEIACASNITAICAQITAENSEIQKYLTVMNM